MGGPISQCVDSRLELLLIHLLQLVYLTAITIVFTEFFHHSDVFGHLRKLIRIQLPLSLFFQSAHERFNLTMKSPFVVVVFRLVVEFECFELLEESVDGNNVLRYFVLVERIGDRLVICSYLLFNFQQSDVRITKLVDFLIEFGVKML